MDLQRFLCTLYNTRIYMGVIFFSFSTSGFRRIPGGYAVGSIPAKVENINFIWRFYGWIGEQPWYGAFWHPRVRNGPGIRLPLKCVRRTSVLCRFSEPTIFYLYTCSSCFSTSAILTKTHFNKTFGHKAGPSSSPSFGVIISVKL